MREAIAIFDTVLQQKNESKKFNRRDTNEKEELSGLNLTFKPMWTIRSWTTLKYLNAVIK